MADNGKKGMNYKSMDALLPVVKVINEADEALNNKERTIADSSISDVLSGALGAGVGAAISFGALYGLGTVGLSAAGITSGLAAAGGIIGGGMVAGIFTLAAPVAILAGAGIVASNKRRAKKLMQEKERLYQKALLKHEGIIKALKEENNKTKERTDYLESLNILLQKIIEELKQDLGLTA